MSVYVIANLTIKDAVRFEDYKRTVMPSMEKYGGRFVARRGPIHVLEGEWPRERLIIAQFPSIERAEQWWVSPEPNVCSNTLTFHDPQPVMFLFVRFNPVRSPARPCRLFITCDLKAPRLYRVAVYQSSPAELVVTPVHRIHRLGAIGSA